MYKEMDKITFKNGEEPYISAPNLNKLQENAEKAIKGRTPTVELLTVSDTAPTTCKTGDKYYNTSTNKIYTATAENTWGTTGEDPTNLDIYVDLEHTKLYYCDGTNFKSYGGGSGTKEVGYTDEELEGTEKILIEDGDFDGVPVNEVVTIETITNDNGTAIKFSDGTMICTMERSFQGTCVNTFGILYETEQFDFGNFPIPFIERPILSTSISDTTGGFVGAIRNRTKSHIGQANFARPIKLETEAEWGIQITAIGRWK
jgi:hypothetical protein